MEKEIVVKREISFWQVLFYFSWSVLAIWLVLKVMGFIKTPIWLEYGIPIGSFMLGVLAIYKNVLEDIHKISMGVLAVTMRVDYLTTNSNKLEKKFNKVDTKVDRIDAKMTHLDRDMHLVKRKIGADF